PSGDLAIGGEEARERAADVVTHAADSHDGGEVLRGEVGAVGPGQDDAAAAAVLTDQDRVLVGVYLSGRAHAPSRRGDAACVDGLDGSREELEPFEEEGTLLRKEEGKPLVGGDLRGVGFDLE